MIFDSYEKATAKADSLMQNIGTANLSYYPREISQEQDEALAPGTSLKL